LISANLDWIKAGHIIAAISWMAGLLYLPRLFVYHAGTVAGTEQSETFKIMERRLYRAIMVPSMIATWVFGLGLAVAGGMFWPLEPWFTIKIAAVVLMTLVHFLLRWRVLVFSENRNDWPARTYRFINEVPTVLMVVIVVTVVVRPFS
jgi:protoporphyrinogen IX oxidase